MIFIISTHGTIFTSNTSNTQYCYQRCSCESEEFVEKFFQCEKKDKIFPKNGILHIDYTEVTFTKTIFNQFF